MNKIQEKVIRCVLDAGEYILVRQIKAAKPEKCSGIILGYLLEGLTDKNDYGSNRRNYTMSDDYAAKLLNLYRSVFWTVHNGVKDSEPHYLNLKEVFDVLPNEMYSPQYFEQYPGLTKMLIGYILECKGASETIKFVMHQKPHDGCSYKHTDFFKPVIDMLCEELYCPKESGYDVLLADISKDCGDGVLLNYAIERVSLCRVKRLLKIDLLNEALRRLNLPAVVTFAVV